MRKLSRGFGILPNKQISPASYIQTTSRKAGNANGSIGFSEVVKKIFKADVSVSGEMESVQTIDKRKPADLLCADRMEGRGRTGNHIVAALLCCPIITLVACHRINRYNDMRTEKGKGSRTPVFREHRVLEPS